VEAARIAWRPLGRLLVEQGLLTDDELERALVQQQVSGKRLGETIVALGFVSGPDLASALATQYGIELTVETGFGTGLRAQIQRRHENDRGMPGPPALSIVEAPADEPEDFSRVVEDTQPDGDGGAEALLLTQLEEQWARLAAAEDALAASEHEIAVLVREGDRRRQQAVRLIGRVRNRDRQLEQSHEQHAQLGHVSEEQREEIGRLTDDAKNRDAEIERLTRDVKERSAEIQRFAGERKNRDAEIARLTHDVENRNAEIDRLTSDAKNRGEEVDRLVSKAKERHAEIERLRREAKDRNTEIERLTHDAENRDAGIDRIADETNGRKAEIERLTDEAKRRNAEITQLTDDAKNRNAEIERLTRDVKERNAEIERIAGEGKNREAEIERLTGDVAGCDAEIARLRQESDRLRAHATRFAARLRREPEQADQLVQPEAPAPVPASHLVFVQLGAGYELVESDGPPPPLHTLLELPQFSEDEFVVTRLGHSPLPADPRSCIFVQRV
jgi:peptidoglycan hydrolase CwlO-like protein